ncbi:MAG TPA: NAD(P)H-hydrate epimerase, partial [Usitatibacteraceae bacterium]|nr:NAD(P)H-hydrate epimerase [Usitatibacteraceae bacterium]
MTCAEMSEAERRFFVGDRSPEPWMDEAGALCAAAILDFFPEPAAAEIFCGKGNNGGDALVVARWLKRHRWRIGLHFAEGPESLSELAKRKLREFEDEPE